MDIEKKSAAQPVPTNLPEPVISSDLLEAIQELKIEYSTKGIDRLVRAHGHTLREIFTLRHGMFKRIPDIILWPSELLANSLLTFISHGYKIEYRFSKNMASCSILFEPRIYQIGEN